MIWIFQLFICPVVQQLKVSSRSLWFSNFSIRSLLVREAHGGGLMGHFGMAQTLTILQECFHWPRMKRDMERLVAKCITSHKAESKF